MIDPEPLVTSPFAVFVWVADAGSPVSAGEALAFQRLLSDSTWCRSAALAETLPRTRARYPELWKSYSARNTPLALADFADAVRAALGELGDSERALAGADLLHIGETVVRGNGLAARLRPLAQPVKEAIEAISRIVASEAARTPTDATSTASAAKPDLSEVRQFMPLVHTDYTKLPRWTGGKIAVRCVKVIPETHDVKTFRFAADPPVLFSHKPGQFLTLELNIEGKRVLRSYTISSPPTSSHLLDITVKRVPDGLVSNFLHDHIKAGDALTVNGCGGKFNCWDIPARKILFISGGSGITPCMAMTRWLRDTESDCDIVFVHSARTPKDIIFRRELELIDAQRENFRLFITCSNPPHGESWPGSIGRINAEILQMVCPDVMERVVFTCGPQPFMAATRSLFEASGFPMDHYHEESFGGRKGVPAARATAASAGLTAAPAAPPKLITQPAEKPAVSVQPKRESAAPPPDAPDAVGKRFNIAFATSGKELICGGEELILELAEKNGIEIASSCRAGNCGTCKTRKGSGSVESDCTDGLTEEEKRDGFILVCVSRPTSAIVLEA
jgi:ferredoxin-NADP reductase